MKTASISSAQPDFWHELPESASGVFRTDSGGSAYWRQLLAWDPRDSFILTSAGQLPELMQFLDDHSNRLCAGYLSYDLGRLLQGVGSGHASSLPLAVFHAYDTWQEDRPDRAPLPVRERLTFSPEMSQLQYQLAIDRIHQYIRAGDFYQLNLTTRLQGATQTASRDLYPGLIQAHPAAHACYFEAEDLTIHSLSPELFLHHQAGILTTEPIKGTRPRSSDPEMDEVNRLALLNSVKEQAELFMITDLLRNDLGKVCQIGSVRLEAVKELRQLPRVWHTLSRLQGRLRSDLTPLEALISMLPGGSITGCPKKRAIEVIDELELSSRGIYTGCIGYIHPEGDLSFNIAIRTLIQQDSKLSLGTGGGITIDSTWAAEWEELLVKASTFT